MSFNDFFMRATRSESEPLGRNPYPYQERFAEAPALPHLLRAPTGAGKTATAVLGWLWRWVSKMPETPRRLVYCLPMRVLVEQSARESAGWIKNLDLEIPVHVLMGGVDTEQWYLHPEQPAVLIGTQDMLLSRALNRGYAASRFHWPIDFGLLNNDCFWVFDEPQLMGSGVSTSAQLEGLRRTDGFGTFGPCPSVWMSATLEPCWLDTVDFRGKFPAPPHDLDGEDYDPNRPLHKRMTATKTLAPVGVFATKDGKEVAAAVAKAHVTGTQTLVILNTVDRAKAVYAAIKKVGAAPKDVLLVHSRFRPRERELLNARLQEARGDRVIVATQVVEAGVDISSRTLVTELAPWASVVQRIGRCNRTGDDGPGQVYWIDLDDEKQASPYEPDALIFARQQLEKLKGKDVSPRALDDFKRKENLKLPFEHKHVIRRRDVIDLFDTSSDLSGTDIDVSRFVRGDDPDTDIQAFWRAGPPDNEWDSDECRRQAARRAELCNVPIGSFKTDFLGTGKTAYRYDYLDGEWRAVGKKDIGSVVPGQVFWVVADQGGYDAQIGWSPGSGALHDHLLVPLPATPPKRRGERPEGFYDSDEWSQADWRTIAEHTDDVVREVTAIVRAEHGLQITDTLKKVLAVAARWHDWGKAHEVFQSGIAERIDDPRDKKLPAEQRRPIVRPTALMGSAFIAKATDEFWKRCTRVMRPADLTTQQPEKRVRVRRFRHELASVLGVLALERTGMLPTDWHLLKSADRLLALYLIMSHHGKVRLSIRTMPEESPIPPAGRRFADGVWEGDKLPAAILGEGVSPPAVVLSLDAMQLGGADSWSAGVLQLRDAAAIGPFRLAYLEALLRAADCRASDLGGGQHL